MKTGLESLDVGASDITYSGNEGPKSPQEDQRMMQEFQMQQMAGGENDRVRELLLLEETQGLTEEEKEELRQLIKTISAGMEGGIGDMAMKSGLIDEYRNYKMGQEDAGEPFMSPRDYYRSQEQDRMGVKEGGIMRTAFQGGGRDAGKGSNFGSENFGGGGERTQGNTAREQGIMNQYKGPGGTTARFNDGPVEYIGGKEYSVNPKTKEEQEQKNFAISIANDKKRNDARKAALRKNVLVKDLSLRNALGLGYTNRTLDSNLEEFGAIGPQGFTIGGLKVPSSINALSEFTVDPATKSFDIDSIRELASTKTTTGGSMSAKDANTLEEIREDIQMRDRILDPNDNVTQSEFNKYMNRNKIEDIGGDGPQIILPRVKPTTDMAVGEDVDIADTDTEDFVSRFGRPSSLPFADYRGGIEVPAADGGRIGYAGGGITDLRQGYFLGKLVKKATRAVKKIVKSPLGKAALAFGAYKFGPQLLSGKGFGLGSVKKFGDLKFLGEAANVNPMRLIGLTSMLPFLTPQEEEEESLDSLTARRGPSIQDVFGMDLNQIAKGARSRTLDPNVFNFLQPAADGGRIGLAAGGIGDLRGALSKEMFGYDDEEDEIKKLAMGGSAGMPPVTMQPGGQDAQSFGDDESTGIAQATPTTTLPNQMPIQRPMMDLRMMQQMMMASKMNPQMGGRMMAAMGGRMMMNMGGGADMGSVNKEIPKIFARDISPKKKNVDRIRIAILKGVADGLFTFEDLTKYDQQGVLPLDEITKPIAEPFYPDRFKDLKPIAEPFYPDRFKDLKPELMSQGGRMMAQEGGMMDMGGMEKDYRNEGGFVPIGEYERKDDVPARLSKNEFVFTADAVRNAGGGDIDKGAEIMENMMENLEAGGKVSKGSQGLSGAREMFATQQRLGEVL